MSIHISLMQMDEVPESAAVLSHAMLNNPLHIAIFQGNSENERQEIETMFIDLLRKLPGIVFLAKERQKIIGVVRMKSCTGRKMVRDPNPPKDEKDMAWRKSVWHKAWASHDPLDQHWHLGPIGVLPSHWGKGVGSQLMQRFCKEVDACGAKAYLETDLDKNVIFYKKFGFEVVSRSMIFQVENRYMLRGSKS
ncbi:MAG: GNAT family N-acetyltransferase [Desulfobacterales bacterium]